MPNLRGTFAALLLAFSLSLLAWGFWPAGGPPHQLQFTPAEMSLPTAGSLLSATTAPPPEIPEARRLTLEYPAAIRSGDSGVARLALEVEPAGSASLTPDGSGSGIAGRTVPAPDLFETHTVVAEANLDLPGVPFQPAGPVGEPLLRGQAASFRWNLRPTTPGTYNGTAWLFLVFTDKATGEQSRLALSAQPIEIRSTTLLGLGGGAARWLGAIGAVLGAGLGLRSAEQLIIWLRQRRRGRN